MFFSRTTRRLYGLGLLLLATAGSWLLGSGSVSASTVHWAISNSSELPKPVVVYADQIAAWKEQQDTILLVSGKVWIGQGLINIWFDRGVIRVRKQSPQAGGHYELRIYAEKNVKAEQGSQRITNDSALLELKSRNDLKFKAANRKIIQQALPNDPLYQRATQQFAAASSLPATPQIEAADPGPANNLPPSLGVPNPLPEEMRPPPPRSVTDTAVAVKPANVIQQTGGQMPAETPEPLPPPSAVPAPPAPSGPPILGGLASGPPRQLIIRPRSSFLGIQARNFALPSGETAVVVSSGVILTVTNADGKGGLLDIEADRLVFWTHGSPQKILNDLQSNRNQKDRPLEFYLSGNVEIRTEMAGESRLLRADEVYYDVNRHVAVATHANLEVDDPRLLNPIHMQADEIIQLNSNLYQATNTAINASALPWDPGFYLTVRDSTLETVPVTRKTIFGRTVIDHKTGQPVQEIHRYFKGNSVFLWLEDVPFFYLPYIQGDVDDPLGPLETVGMNYNQIFGFQLYTTWDVYDLVGVTAEPGTRWRLNLDYLSRRGPAVGTDFSTHGLNLFDIPNRYLGFVKAYGIHDTAEDILGNDRGRSIAINPTTRVPVDHPDFRGRLLSRWNVLDMPYGFSAQSQLALISDRNFMEQYFLPEWLNDLNQETYLYIKQQQGSWAWTGFTRPHLRNWITETEWLPRFDGYILGASFFDLVTYNLKASAGYAELEPTDEPAFAFSPTDVDINTGRFDLWQEASIPFPLGPFKLVTNGIVDLTYYTNDLTGEDRGRFYGAGGLRGSMPLSRLYPDVHSEFFNLHGIYHKINLTGNYYVAHSDTSFRQLPQLDRFNDDASDQSLRDIRPLLPALYPKTAAALTSPLFDPQVYALRRLILNRIDTRDDIQVLQTGIEQRWQTKRGFPGREHIIDWMTLNLSGSIFPNADRDNFGETFAFLEYDWTWNIGDRTSLVSNGWIDPIDNGPRVLNIGADFNRTDETQLYLGYRQIDPLESKAIIASASYRFSRKYSVTASAAYDFGIDNQSTTVIVTRYGKDLRFSFGLTHNSILNTFGVVFEIMPNLFPTQIHSPGSTGNLIANTQASR